LKKFKKIVIKNRKNKKVILRIVTTKLANHKSQKLTNREA